MSKTALLPPDQTVAEDEPWIQVGDWQVHQAAHQTGTETHLNTHNKEANSYMIVSSQNMK